MLHIINTTFIVYKLHIILCVSYCNKNCENNYKLYAPTFMKPIKYIWKYLSHKSHALGKSITTFIFITTISFGCITAIVFTWDESFLPPGPVWRTHYCVIVEVNFRNWEAWSRVIAVTQPVLTKLLYWKLLTTNVKLKNNIPHYLQPEDKTKCLHTFENTV